MCYFGERKSDRVLLGTKFHTNSSHKKIPATIYSIAGVISVLPGGEYHPKFQHW